MPPPVNHEITWYHKYERDEGEEAEKYEDWGGVRCEGKGQRDEVEYKGGKMQED